jgi:hypothetical protein
LINLVPHKISDSLVFFVAQVFGVNELPHRAVIRLESSFRRGRLTAHSFLLNRRNNTVPEDPKNTIVPSILASIPASILNLTRDLLGILFRFRITSSRSRAL